METVPRFFKSPEASFFLFGPRGTGKSTLVRKLFLAALWIDLLEPDVQRSLSARPERLRELIEGRRSTEDVVVIDEIQRVPELLTSVHALIEKKLGVRFVLTGSSTRKLRRAGVDLLAGRALERHLHPFLAAEIGDRFRLDRALQQGLVPLVTESSDPAEVLKSYASLYLREEVQMERLVRQVGDFARFLEAISFSHGSVLNIANVARDCEVERKTVAGYVEILEDLLLSFRLPVFTKRAQRATSSHPRFYLFDCGVFRSIRPAGPLDRPEEIEGAALEGLVAQHLRAWNDFRGRRNQLAFWRTRTGVEVDFIVHGADGFWAIEVKNGAKIRPADLRGLKTFHADYPECTPILLHRGRERLKRDDVLCIPCAEFQAAVRPERLLLSGL